MEQCNQGDLQQLSKRAVAVGSYPGLMKLNQRREEGREALKQEPVNQDVKVVDENIEIPPIHEGQGDASKVTTQELGQNNKMKEAVQDTSIMRQRSTTNEPRVTRAGGNQQDKDGWITPSKKGRQVNKQDQTRSPNSFKVLEKEGTSKAQNDGVVVESMTAQAITCKVNHVTGQREFKMISV
ncbi:hypothetical protein K7X08_020855 [Anisodus acutangulus]|uniref:Uncharacterized protein n=1 Tax=Anisodus acutangulus TaxID=402998 RepID=A0A9Q1MTM8_9SOLA|nr:hypothetical protein K7X08_020855 [Anisodus acutangulus]